MNIFDLINNEPIITIEGLHIPEFTVLWKLDKKADKLKASGAIKYVYHMASPASIYAKSSPEDRPLLVREDCIVNDWFPEKEIQLAIDKVKILEETEAMRFLASAEYALKKLEEFNYSVDFKALDDKGKPIYNVRDVVNTIKEAGKLFESLDSLKDLVTKQKATTAKRKGNVKPSTILHD
jgi:hypothetical protein